ncbi:hypothetical protein E2C01_027980 [Portunus trituberculatus]|uniref:Uncharacterized protein n=1 Tax=Portunus trituberculatus TaxID=210409 RepID=A0A5B7EN05_PORTR|nr:hypothetical protein [Portunus trituberculatus]
MDNPSQITPGVRRAARAHDPSLASSSPPTLPLQPQDSSSMPSLSVHSDSSNLGGVSPLSPFHFSDSACSPVASSTNGDGCWAVSLTQNNPLYRSYDEVNGSLDDLGDGSFERDSLDGVGVCGADADVESVEGDDTEHDDGSGISHNPRGDSHARDLRMGHWPGFVPHGQNSKVLMSGRQENVDSESIKFPERKYSSGFSSNSDFSDEDQYADYDEVYDPSTCQFAAQLSKSIKEKLLNPKVGQDEDANQKLKTSALALPPISSSSSSSTSSKPGTGGARSLLVRTLTMPLKYAAQHRQSLTKVFSRSQPSTPELPRRNQVSRSYVRPDQINKILPSSSWNVDSRKLEFFDRSSLSAKNSNSKKKASQEKKSPTGKPPKPPGAHSKPVTRKTSTLSRQASFRNPFPTPPVKSPPPNALDSWPADPCNNPILEPCTTCARNVAANIQHASIWGELENLPRGYIANVEESKMFNYKRKTKEDCKLQ